MISILGATTLALACSLSFVEMRHVATYEYGIRLRRLKNNFITGGTWRNDN